MKLPKLNLRDLLWLIAVVAISLAWRLDHSALAKESRENKDQSLTLQNRLIAAQVRVAELKAMRKAYQKRLAEFGQFSLSTTGAMEYEVVPDINGD